VGHYDSSIASPTKDFDSELKKIETSKKLGEIGIKELKVLVCEISIKLSGLNTNIFNDLAQNVNKMHDIFQKT